MKGASEAEARHFNESIFSVYRGDGLVAVADSLLFFAFSAFIQGEYSFCRGSFEPHQVHQMRWGIVQLLDYFDDLLIDF